MIKRLAVLGIIVVAGCGGGARVDAPATSTNKVEIDTFMFGPRRLDVHAGDTVTWTNHDNIVHTVTSGTREYAPTDSGLVTATHKDGMFDTPLDGPGSTTTFTFHDTGTFHYFCDRHPGMEAEVAVS
jgi:plastocyanin